MVRITFLSLYASGIRSISVKSRDEDERERGSDSKSGEAGVVGPTIALGFTINEKVNHEHNKENKSNFYFNILRVE